MENKTPFEHRELIYFMVVAIILNVLIAGIVIVMTASHLDKMDKKMDSISETLEQWELK
jgi:capsular polysaccharide biosynthesis protein